MAGEEAVGKGSGGSLSKGCSSTPRSICMVCLTRELYKEFNRAVQFGCKSKPSISEAGDGLAEPSLVSGFRVDCFEVKYHTWFFLLLLFLNFPLTHGARGSAGTGGSESVGGY